ncbi:hypothetical protein ACN6MY_17785 [Peribacillus sp. B-H-3]|uniref:hypothetical protein n=1 Tax=Peribacillus sp. B-H-3 TaxID=3400420 RepID=UPI003B028F0C
MKTTVKWDGYLAFSGITPSGHKIAMDASEEAGGALTRGKAHKMLLHAVAGVPGLILF